MIKKILQFNDRKFLDDLKSVRDVLVIPPKSGAYLHVLKKEVLREAETTRIEYYLTYDIFVVRRLAMVIV